MELEVGMYVRTKRDGIGKIISLSIGEEDECCFIELPKRRTGIKEHNIVKASHNIIGLIEVGDYVNGYIVLDITKDNLGEKYIECGCKDEISYNYVYDTFYNKDIKTIVTKEQFEAIQYKVV